MTTEESFGRYAMAEARFMQTTFRSIITVYSEKQQLKAIHLYVLGMLSLEKGQTLVQLSERARMTASNLSPICTLLEKQELIKRLPHDTDGRSSFLYLTEKGNQILDGLDEWLDQILSSAGADNARLHDSVRKGFQAFRTLVELAGEKETENE